MKRVGGILALPLALLLVVFAVANRHEVRLELWPLPFALDLPAYLLVFLSALAGLMLGAAVTWLAGARSRRRARSERRRAEALERQLAEVNQRQLAEVKGPTPSP